MNWFSDYHPGQANIGPDAPVESWDLEKLIAKLQQ